MQIEPEAPADIDAISKLLYAAFKDHPHHPPNSEPTEHIIVEKLRANNALSLSLVAKDNDTLQGYIAFSKVKIDGKDENCEEKH